MIKRKIFSSAWWLKWFGISITANVSESAELPCYVRCSYCDTAVNKDKALSLDIWMTEEGRHDLANYQCPACDIWGNSFIFPGT